MIPGAQLQKERYDGFALLSRITVKILENLENSFIRIIMTSPHCLYYSVYLSGQMVEIKFPRVWAVFLRLALVMRAGLMCSFLTIFGATSQKICQKWHNISKLFREQSILPLPLRVSREDYWPAINLDGWVADRHA